MSPPRVLTTLAGDLLVGDWLWRGGRACGCFYAVDDFFDDLSRKTFADRAGCVVHAALGKRQPAAAVTAFGVQLLERDLSLLGR